MARPQSRHRAVRTANERCRAQRLQDKWQHLVGTDVWIINNRLLLRFRCTSSGNCPVTAGTCLSSAMRVVVFHRCLLPKPAQRRLADMRADGAMIGQPVGHGSGHRDIRVAGVLVACHEFDIHLRISPAKAGDRQERSGRAAVAQ